MPDDPELFTHTVTAWTLGDLRKAVAAAEGLPDEFPVTVVPAEEPGGDLAGEEQVIISAGPWGGLEDAVPDHFEIGCEFPSGEYYRRSR
jgi:hypothetical protein